MITFNNGAAEVTLPSPLYLPSAIDRAIADYSNILEINKTKCSLQLKLIDSKTDIKTAAREFCNHVLILMKNG